MRLVILEDSERVAEWAARYIIKRINDFKAGPNKFFVLGLPTGEVVCLFVCLLGVYAKGRNHMSEI